MLRPFEKIPVYIQLNCKTEENIERAGLILRTLQVGFPKNPVYVFASVAHLSVNIIRMWEPKITRFVDVGDTPHWMWIKSLFMFSLRPFFICDTDIVFWDSVEILFKGVLDGCHIPPAIAGESVVEHYDIITKSIMHSKIHTALMYLDPMVYQDEVRRLSAVLPHIYAVESSFDLLKPEFIWIDGIRYYYDILTKFTHASDAISFFYNSPLVFTHLHAGSWIDEMEKIEPQFAQNLRAQHEAVYNDINNAKPLREQHKHYYKVMSKKAAEIKGDLE